MNNIIILAAGKGTRMQSELPKCACPILGKPMIEYLIDSCIEIGIQNIIVVVGYKKENIKVLYEKEIDGQNVNICKYCNAALKNKARKAVAAPATSEEASTEA